MTKSSAGWARLGWAVVVLSLRAGEGTDRADETRMRGRDPQVEMRLLKLTVSLKSRYTESGELILQKYGKG